MEMVDHFDSPMALLEEDASVFIAYTDEDGYPNHVERVEAVDLFGWDGYPALWFYVGDESGNPGRR